MPLIQSPRAKRYHISQEDLDVQLAAAGGRCDICGDKFDTLCVDHCHSTGRVRGLLCSRHNLLLGMAGDDAMILLRAAGYLTGMEYAAKTPRAPKPIVFDGQLDWVARLPNLPPACGPLGPSRDFQDIPVRISSTAVI